MISAVVLTKNEEKNIVDCLESLTWCDEILVIDDNSEDRTPEVAKKFGAKVFVQALAENFSRQRNFGLQQAQNDWVLFIDADERVSPGLAREIKYQIANRKNNDINGFYVKRVDFLWRRELKHGETGNMRLLRLARKDTGAWEGAVHEKWRIKVKVGELKNPLLHYPHQTIAEFLREINFYTTLRATELYKKGLKVHWYDIILQPKVKFIYNYFFKSGFLDGIPGLIFAMMMSFHSFLVRGKLWLLWKKR